MNAPWYGSLHRRKPECGTIRCVESVSLPARERSAQTSHSLRKKQRPPHILFKNSESRTRETRVYRTKKVFNAYRFCFRSTIVRAPGGIVRTLTKRCRKKSSHDVCHTHMTLEKSPPEQRSIEEICLGSTTQVFPEGVDRRRDNLLSHGSGNIECETLALDSYKR